MPTQKYKVETDKGAFIVEVEAPEEPYVPTKVPLGPQPGPQTEGQLTNRPTLMMRLIDSLKGSAHPQSLGDILPLLVPAGAEAAVSGAKTLASTAKSAISESPTLRGVPGRMMKKLWDAPIVERPIAPHILRARNAIDNPLSTTGMTNEELFALPQRVDPNIPPHFGADPASWRKAAQEVADRTDPEAWRRTARPEPFQPLDIPEGNPEAWRANINPTSIVETSGGRPLTRPGMPPRLAGKAPTVEDELVKALEGSRAPESPTTVSGTPETTITPGGATRQSGKFGKSDSLGQAGGYSSGRPAVTGAQQPVPEVAQPSPWDPSWATETPGEAPRLLEGSRYLSEPSGRSGAVGGPEAADVRSYFRTPGVLDQLLEMMRGR